MFVKSAVMMRRQLDTDFTLDFTRFLLIGYCLVSGTNIIPHLIWGREGGGVLSTVNNIESFGGSYPSI